MDTRFRLFSLVKKILKLTGVILLGAAVVGPAYPLAVDRELQADMVTLSMRGCQVIAEKSGHGIGRQPELVIQAIRDVLVAAGDRKPGC